MEPQLDAIQDVEPPLSARERRLTLIDHLEELRQRLWKCLAIIAVATALCFTQAGALLAWLKAPAGEALEHLAFFGPADALMAHLKIAVTGGIVLSLPFLLHQTWAFIRPALTARERTVGASFVGWGSVLFVCGAAFAYGVMLPGVLRFLLTFGTPALEPIISVNRYVGFVTTMLLVSGAAFELPLVIFLLARLSIVTPRQLRRQWRVAYLVIAIGAALLTPSPDVATMLLLTVPLLALYEISIVVARLATAGRRRDA